MTTTNLPFERFGGVSPNRLLLATDFDGTLSEIVPRPSTAQPLPDSINALRRLATRVLGVVVISGRPTSALRDLLPIPGLRHLGDYGLGEPTTEERLALAKFNADMGVLVPRWEGVRLEPKPGSTSLHFRDDPGAAQDLLRAATPVAERHGLRARLGRMVVEVTPGRAQKEVALQALIEQLGPAAVFFAGDDTGDGGCFQLVARLEIPHLAVGVASEEADQALFAPCDLIVRGPGELAGLLSRIADWAEGGRPPG